MLKGRGDSWGHPGTGQMWLGLALHVPWPKATGWDMEEQMCSYFCLQWPHRAVVPGPAGCGLVTGYGHWQWLKLQKSTGGYPSVARGCCRVPAPEVSGSPGAQCPPGRSQEQHRLWMEMGDCGQRV